MKSKLCSFIKCIDQLTISNKISTKHQHVIEKEEKSATVSSHVLFNQDDEQCRCDSLSIDGSYAVIDYYHSILDRDQPFLYSWKVVDRNGQIHLTRGTLCRTNTNAFVLRTDRFCLINPWYEFIDGTTLLPQLKQCQSHKVLEIVLLERNHSSMQYDISIVECSCRQRTKTYCAYCRSILMVTEQNNNSQLTRPSRTICQQTDISFSWDFFDDHGEPIGKDDFILSQPGPHRYQHSVQIQVKSDRVLRALDEIINRFTKRKSVPLITVASSDGVNTLSGIDPKSETHSLLPQVVVEDDNGSMLQIKPIAHQEDGGIQSPSRTSGGSLSLQHFLLKPHSSLNTPWSPHFMDTSPLLVASESDRQHGNDPSLDDTEFEALTKYVSRGTQTKLFAILLPERPLSEMKRAKIVTRTSTHVTRSCQVNTLTYLIHTDESQTRVHHSITGIWGVQQIDRSSITSFLYNESRRMQNKTPEEHSSTTTQKRFSEYHRRDEVPVIEFEGGEMLDDYGDTKNSSPSVSRLDEEEVVPVKEQQEESIWKSPSSSPRKRTHFCKNVHQDNSSFVSIESKSTVPMISPLLQDDSIWKSHHTRGRKYCRDMNTINFEHIDTQFAASNNSTVGNINHSEEALSDQSLVSLDDYSSDKCQKLHVNGSKNNNYAYTFRNRRQERRYRNQCASRFIRRLRRRRKRKLALSSFSSSSFLPSPSICSSSIDIVADQQQQQNETRSLSTQTDAFIRHELKLTSPLLSHQSVPLSGDNRRRISSPNQRYPSTIDLHLDNPTLPGRFNARDHTIVVRAPSNSEVCRNLQSLLNETDTSFDQLIHTQLTWTCNNDFKSVCILIDDHQQSKQHRSAFFNHIYTTISTTLTTMLGNNKSRRLTCINLVLFNNALYNLVNMQRVRLIDTGKKVLLLPFCETSLTTENDITASIDRLSVDMPFVHRIFIVNCYRTQSLASSSFLFLHLAPISSSFRRIPLLISMNSTTYSVLNTIRQLTNGRKKQRYSLNECSLTRLLKNYLFSRHQTMLVLTVQSKVVLRGKSHHPSDRFPTRLRRRKRN